MFVVCSLLSPLEQVFCCSVAIEGSSDLYVRFCSDQFPDVSAELPGCASKRCHFLAVLHPVLNGLLDSAGLRCGVHCCMTCSVQQLWGRMSAVLLHGPK